MRSGLLQSSQTSASKLPPQQESGSVASLNHFFLQLTVHDLGVCLPIPDYSNKDNGEVSHYLTLKLNS